jgi:hypothetical protein
VGAPCASASAAGTSPAATTLRGRHATAHFTATEHPVIKSFEPGEAWVWCYVDKQMYEYGA